MNGVLPNQEIEKLIEVGSIISDVPIDPEQIQPASLDLRLSGKAFRIRASFLPGSREKVEDRLKSLKMHEIDLIDGAVLEKGCVYLVPLLEELNLSQDIQAAANAKSSTGRLDLLTRVITNSGEEFDRVSSGYCGNLYAEICPRSFSVLVRQGMKLNQIRFRNKNTTLNDEDLTALHAQEKLVPGNAIIDDGLGFSVDLIDLDLIDYYDPAEFWDEIKTSQGEIILDPGAFYILVSRESVHIPPEYAAEMAPYVAMVGEFRVHYAGFFDPGFGHNAAGGSGARGVLEVRCHEAPFVLEHGQVVGRLIYEKMSNRPTKLYGQGVKSNYQGQGLKLSKHFKKSF